LYDVLNPEILVQTSFTETHIKLMVQDNGQGFPVDLIAKAFEPYVTTKAHGTGLGLAIVKKMVEEHFGQIKIENNSTGGASISISLPIEKAAIKPLLVVNNQPTQSQETTQLTQTSSKK
jgi:nitrogen fixation/metabolism regulation signal transduction histidine kinase